MSGSGLVLLLAVVSATAEDESASRSSGFELSVQPFLSEHCQSCHGSTRKNRSDLNLDDYPDVEAIAGSPHVWERVLEKLASGAMPPEERPRPDPDQLERVMAWIAGEVDRANARAEPDPGRVTARRLNRTEYDNSVRDLLGVDLGAARDFPQDDAGYGFDNIGDVLSVSPLLMDKYLAAAERLARRALFGVEQADPVLARLDARQSRIEPRTEPEPGYDETGLSLPGALHLEHHFPATGEYEFRVVMGGSHPLGGDPMRVGLWIDGELVDEVEYDPEPDPYAVLEQDLWGRAVFLRARVEEGQRWVAATRLRLYEGLPARYGGPRPTRRAPYVPTFEPPPNTTPRRFERARQGFQRAKARVPPINQARPSQLELRGPFDVAPGPTAGSVARVFVCGHAPGAEHAPGCARRIVSSLARRAFRRPVSNDELKRLLQLVELGRDGGASLEEGLAVALQAILVSPDFLFRIEREPEGLEPGAIYPVSAHELATRLSYFLWTSTPDEELLALADTGALSDAPVLEQQVRRMLADPRSGALASDFASQWLHFRGLQGVEPDPERFPDFDEYLRIAMRRESELFFESLVREDGSVLDLIAGRYSFLNERLARHYGIDGVEGPDFRRVALPGDRRGGVLTQGSVLTVTSYSTRTSPVLRGKWILENLLDAAPPDPPPDVPNLDEAAIGAATSLREQLEVHRADPTCRSCHSQMDPLGFGLENFDAVGGWRESDGRFAIDASGTLPDGRRFEGPAGLRSILSGRGEAFAEALAGRMLTYALGRGLEPYDRLTVRRIAERLVDADYRFSELVLGIVESPPFRLRRAGGES